jgi:hypothetical protein
MSILTNAGRAALAKGIREQSIFLAWGTGGAEWGETPPPEDIGAEALVNEIGRKALWRSLYVLPDEEGELLLPSGRYAVSAAPTRFLYLQFLFDFTDGAGSTIREMGVFVGGSVVEGLPPGQTYFTPTEVANPGALLMLMHREPIVRVASERFAAETVISL